MNNIKQRKASVDSPDTTRIPIPPHDEEIDAMTVASVDCRNADHLVAAELLLCVA